MKLGSLTAALLVSASSALAQHAHTSDRPVETGQAQFAAIAEVVAALRDDPKTNWTKVNIKALRDHLVDMDNVTTKAMVERQINGLQITFSITGDNSVEGSITRMVLAHSPMLQKATDWSVAAEKQSGGALMTVNVQTQDAMDRVAGLGFFGLLTIGAHHQQHHLMIAKGRSPH